MFYIMLFGFVTMTSMILRFNSEKFSFGMFKQSECAEGHEYCKGDLAVYRISFVLVLFFTAMMAASMASEAVHRGFWGVKILVILAGIIGSFWIPQDSFNVHSYAWFARVGSVLFLVLQILILIDFAYQWNESWVAKAYGGGDSLEVQDKNWIIAILTMAGVLLASSLTGIVLLYTFYSKCPVGVSFTTLTLLGAIIMTVLSVFRDKIVHSEMQGAILPTAIVVAYSVFLAWSALGANPDSTCLPAFQHKSLDMTFGTLFATVTLMWTAFSVTSNAAHLVKGESLEKAGSNNTEAVGGGPVVSAGDLEEGMLGDDDESVDTPVYSNEPSWVFHLIMISASMYQAMLLTDWGSSKGPASAGEASMWMKIVAQWLTVILFSWTMVAPAILKDRDFDF